MQIDQLMKEISIYAVPIILAVVVHEVSHGFTAERFGDKTARMLGRLTLNPLAHIDPFGTILLPILFFMTTGMIFGYAKPVPVDFRNLRRPKEDMVWVAAAGPLSNIALALISAGLLKMLYLFAYTTIQYKGVGWFIIPLLNMLTASIEINVIFAFINCIPIPPLDGGRILAGLLPPKQSYSYSKLEPFGIILFILIISFDPFGIVAHIVMPMVSRVIGWMMPG